MQCHRCFTVPRRRHLAAAPPPSSSGTAHGTHAAGCVQLCTADARCSRGRNETRSRTFREGPRPTRAPFNAILTKLYETHVNTDDLFKSWYHETDRNACFKSELSNNKIPLQRLWCFINPLKNRDIRHDFGVSCISNILIKYLKNLFFFFKSTVTCFYYVILKTQTRITKICRLQCVR